MAAFLPALLQFLPLVPGLIESGIKFADVLSRHPGTPEEDKAAILDFKAGLQVALLAVRDMRLPEILPE